MCQDARSSQKASVRWFGWLAAVSVPLAALLVGDGVESASAGKIGFIEDFVLAKDREAVLAQLIPGTEDFYYYHCLHNQQAERFDRVDELLQDWIERHGHTLRVREIRHRQALLTYRKSPEKTLDYLKRELNLRFDHQKTELNKKPNLPGRLDPDLIARDTLTRRALTSRADLGGFEDRALDWLIGREKDLGPDRRRMLLQRLDRPDHAGLVQMIAADLDHRYSGGFGSLPIHSELLLAQLDELLGIKPELRSQTNFVNVYLTRLHPKQDVDWRHNPEEKLAYLQRLWDYARTLNPAHNSLKAHVLYHRLALDRSRGVYDKERFLEYLKLPRHMSYVERDYLSRPEHQRWPANLAQDFRAVTLLPPVGNDEPLVRDFLMHFFVEETEITPYATYIEDNYLKKLLAETKIVNGLGDVERWASMLPPEEYRQLKERIDLDFAPTNDEQFDADEPVGLDVHVKNVRTLIVKVYEINTRSWYRETLREVDTDINLDGLVPNVEKTHTYDEPAVRRVQRHFEFPSLTGRGIYVIDFIGNGKSSRALVRKGRLHYVLRTGIGGQVFTVLNEENEPVPAATLWLAGHEYRADKEGHALVPFTNNPSSQPVVLCDGSFCSLAHFPHQPENYTLQAAFHVDREQLLRRNTARLAVRPQLLLGGTPVTLSVLEDVRLTVTATDHEGVTTTEEFRGEALKLHQDKETVVEFSVPERLARLNFSLTAKVENLSQGEDTNLAAAEQFQVNQIDATTKTEDLFLAQFDGQYVVELLGRTGEPLADRPVRFNFKHQGFTQTVDVTLQTDQSGRIVLGELPGIEWVQATSPQDVQTKWPLRHDEHTNLANRHGKAGAPLEVAILPDGEDGKVSRENVSLLELRGDTFYADRFDALTLEDGILRLSDLPRGDYDLFLKEERRHVRIRLTPGDLTDAYVLGPERHLQLVNPRPLQIASVRPEDKTLRIRLVNANKLTRVHVVATRYRPAWSAFQEFAGMSRPEPAWLTVPNTLSAYVEGRNIGDEYRYIIDRRYAPKFPGNMLDRPSLLLNPWAVRDTQTDRQDPAGGDDFAPEGEPPAGEMFQPPAPPAPPTEYVDFSNLDFLGEPAVVLHNLTPDEDGVITVERDKLGPHPYVQVVALDAINTASRLVTLPEPKTRTKDLRLADSLDLGEHYALQKQVSVLKPDEKFTLSHLETARFEAYDSLQSLFVLFTTLSQDRTLVQFRFLVDWPNLTPQEKREKYSEYACHEVDFFLYHKDPDFFREVVQPFIANKKDKTFVDLWLTGADLSRFLQPWEYGQLNAFEKVLLARRIEEERRHTGRHLRDLLAIRPPDVERQERLFSTAVRGMSLSAGDRFGLEKAKSKMREQDYLGLMFDQPTAPASPDVTGARRTSESGTATGPSGGRPGGEKYQNESGEAKEDAKPSEGKPGDEQQAAQTYRRGDDGEAAARDKRGREADNDFAKDINGIMDGSGLFGDELAIELKRRQGARQFFRKLDKTKEWIENYYWHVPLADCGPNLIEPSPLWAAYAGHDGDEPFYSTEVAESARNLHEILVALAVLDLPFEPQKHDIQFAESTMTVTPGSPMIVFHEEIKPAELAEDTPILVSQNVFRVDDRYRYENGERSDKYVTDEFLKHVVYGGQIVVTNPTSTRQKLRVLTQIPVGAIPVGGSQRLRSVPVDLQPYHTQTVEYYFYFPFAGDFPQYPAHVAKDEKTVAHAGPRSFHVVDEPSRIDRESWEFVSQEGSGEEVLTFLERHNLHRLDLGRIAFRMRDQEFFGRVIELLGRRHAYSHVLWSYAIYHDQTPVIREYLEHADEFLAQCGEYLDSPLVDIDPLLRRTYQHRDYRPLVNARKHQLGREREILNDRLHEHYHHLLKILSYHRGLSDENRMAVVYYLLLQHRIAEALDFFEEVNPDALATRLQYDYFKAYLAMYQAEVDQADAVAGKYENYPVDRWREAFVAVSQQIDEIRGADVRVVDEEDRDQGQTKLAATESTFDFRLEGDEVALTYQNLDSVQVNYYLMDVELLFSRSPFVEAGTERFAFIKPNESQSVELPEDQSRLTFRLPQKLRSRNVLVQVVGGGRTASEPYYANTLTVTTSENYGQLLVKSAATGKPEPTVYVKVYARTRDGQVQFYKDGYTDLRGRFDYVSLSTNELENVHTFALLVLSDEHGAIVREAKPPQR